MSDDRDRVARLERRIERERRARTDAERIAEDGIRALYDANQSLDRRIADRTRELEHATRRAEAASNARGAFLAHISHEMRTPLNGIAGMLELLAGRIDDTEAQSWLASAHLSAEHLDRLFERTLRVVELESTDLGAEAHPMDVEEILVAAGDRWRDRCMRNGQLLSVETRTPGGCLVNSTDDCAVVLDELLHNVVVHAARGAVTIASELGDDVVRFAVDDSGPGMADGGSQAARPAALDPHESPTTRRTHGSGLGLALADRIIGALGGSFGTEPNEMGGTRAWFELPVAAST